MREENLTRELLADRRRERRWRNIRWAGYMIVLLLFFIILFFGFGFGFSDKSSSSGSG